ncbi:MAG: putative RNase H-like HicB family nuclease [Limisphaerales bacterium]|jgi:predicted RNase H-like HicB family nuclease
MKYTIVLEKGESSFGAFVPDLPGCIAAGETQQETLQLIKEAIEFHIEGLKADKQEIPPPQCNIAQVEVNVA